MLQAIAHCNVGGYTNHMRYNEALTKETEFVKLINHAVMIVV